MCIPTRAIFFLAALTSFALFSAACSGKGLRFHEMRGEQRFEVLTVFDGDARPGDVLAFDGSRRDPLGAPVTGFWDHSEFFADTDCGGPTGLSMLLAFQFAKDKGPADFETFKELDKPWVAANNGCNTATVFTERTDDWPFDAFELIAFSSVEDFRTAYAGNEELGAAGEGLFGPGVLVVEVRALDR